MSNDGQAMKGSLSFYNQNGTLTGSIAAGETMFYVGADRNYIDELPYNSLASLRCVLYLECSTAVSLQMERTVNLLSATFDKGAHFVLGTTDTVFTNNSDLNEIDVPDGEYNCIYGNIYKPYHECGKSKWQKLYKLYFRYDG